MARLDVDVRRRGADDHFVLASTSPAGDNVRAPTRRASLEPGDVVNVEISPSVDGQFVQICRTVVLGEAEPRRRRDYALLIEAFARGTAAARTGATVADVVAALDAPLVAAGLAEYCRPPYIRVRGHGQGLASVAPGDITWDNDTPLAAGMMFTLHPNQRFPAAATCCAASRSGRRRGRHRAVDAPAARPRRGRVSWLETMQPVVLRGRSGPGAAAGGVRAARRRALRQELARQGLDALVVHGNARNYAPLTWVTGFIPMTRWGVAVVPADGGVELYLATPGTRDLPAMRKLAAVDAVAGIAAVRDLGAALRPDRDRRRA